MIIRSTITKLQLVASSSSFLMAAHGMNVQGARHLQGSTSTTTDEVVLYENDFETPNQPWGIGQCETTSVDNTPINTMYGCTSSSCPTTTTGLFGQHFTVETVKISHCWDHFVGGDPCNQPYENPQGIGGNYAIGLLSNAQEDKLWLDFTAPADLSYLNVELDVSAIDVHGCGGPVNDSPFTNGPPKLIFKLGDHDTERQIDEQSITGDTPPNQWTYRWTHHIVSLHKGTGTTNLRLLIDADHNGGSGYQVFDNLRIFATATEPPPPSPTTNPPEPTPSPTLATGDPHLRNFNGEWFTYMGECDLVLMHVPSSGGQPQLDVHIRTTIRDDYSYIESAAIKIGEDVLEVSSYGQYSINGVEDAVVDGGGRNADDSHTTLRKPPKVVSFLGGCPIYHTMVSKKKSMFEIVLDDESGANITMSTIRDFVTVEVHQTHHQNRFANVVGLMGNQNGEMMARDGITNLHNNKIDAMAQEWQVRNNEPKLFRTSRSPRHPQQNCRLPPATSLEEKESRRLGEGISEEEAEIACADFRDNGDAFAACVYDVTATNDLDLAGGTY